MTPTDTINLIGELSTNLKSVTDSNEELSEAERKYLYGLSAGMKLATDTIKTAIERENDKCKAITALSSKSIKPDLLIGNGYCSQKIASFDSEECAEGFCEMLDKWLQIESEESK